LAKCSRPDHPVEQEDGAGFAEGEVIGDFLVAVLGEAPQGVGIQLLKGTVIPQLPATVRD
jgi:hypothetical protein